MKAAPVQLTDVSFLKSSVEVDVERFIVGKTEQKAYSFENVGFDLAVELSEPESDRAVSKTYHLQLAFSCRNHILPDMQDQRFLPYKLDVVAIGTLELAGKLDASSAEQVITVNGASLVWGAIREQVVYLTSRMPPGHLMLPTVQFFDLID